MKKTVLLAAASVLVLGVTTLSTASIARERNERPRHEDRRDHEHQNDKKQDRHDNDRGDDRGRGGHGKDDGAGHR
jgi:Ni/Co efflux regulator RcnB